MFDPYARIVYDYIGGMEDLRKSKVCMYFLTIVVSYITLLVGNVLSPHIVFCGHRCKL